MNHCIFVGTVAHDLELKKTPSGTSCMNFRMYVNNQSQNKSKVKESALLSFEIWDTAAEFLAEHAKKGSKILVESSVKERIVESEDKKTKYLNFRVNKFQILSE